ncbi:hypothetical protein [Streptomyces sp. NPDC001985]|uniref:hypothetical protein n=1 Tax=Streptomyces sp. NPDC001985 TaxID=3154406 RepID=UPI00331D8017
MSQSRPDSPSGSTAPSASADGPSPAVPPSGARRPGGVGPAEEEIPDEDDREGADGDAREDTGEEAGEPPAGSLSPYAPAAARQRRSERAPEPMAHQQVSPLSLGIGMALMGLGIGFLGVRMRRR